MLNRLQYFTYYYQNFKNITKEVSQIVAYPNQVLLAFYLAGAQNILRAAIRKHISIHSLNHT
ncbi:MAG: hypothetical protein ACO1OF_18460 [Adhaeribacter sp.]